MISAALWAASIGLVFWWSFSPLFIAHRPAPKIQTTAAEDTDALLEAQNDQHQPDEARTKELFRIRLAPLVPPVRPSIADDLPPDPRPFDFRNWAVRETKRRAFLCFLGLMISGSLLQWLIHRWGHSRPDEAGTTSTA